MPFFSFFSFYYGQNVFCTFTSEIKDYYYYYYCMVTLRENVHEESQQDNALDIQTC